jgi:glutathione S-transferase
MLQIYLDPCTVNSRKVLAGLDLLGTQYNLNKVDYLAGAHKGVDYLKINPNATVPAAVDGDLAITESNAILQYAADHGGSDSAYPKDLKKRADVNRWLLWEASAWFQSCYVYLVEYVVKPLLQAEPDQAAVDAQAPRWHQLAAVLDGQLAKTKWLTGDDVTIADIAVAAPMHVHAAQRLPLDQYPNLKRWLTEGVEKLPCWQKTQDAVDRVLLPRAAAAEDTTTTTKSTTAPTEVRSTFNYTKEFDSPTEIYFYETEAAKDIHEPGDDPQEMAVTNGWHRADSFSVDKEGFAIREFKSAYDGWEDDEAVKATFYPEVVEFLKKTVGAKRVLVFDHTIRTAANAQKKLTEEKNTSQRTPVMLVHCDYTAESGPLRVRQLLPDEADQLLSRRVAFFNVWKPIHRVVQERPLAMCDVTSSSPSDFFKLILRYRDRTGENYVMRHSPKHKWWYFPQMTPEQAVLLKTYESETDGRARFVGHTAFEDPTSPPDAPFRDSVEIRTMAFF